MVILGNGRSGPRRDTSPGAAQRRAPDEEPRTIAQLFRQTAQRHPARDALVANGIRLSFHELDARTDRLAAALRRNGLGRGSVVATLLLDGVAMVELLIATAKLGATIVTLNWRLSAPELRYIIADAEPAMIVLSERFADLLDVTGATVPTAALPDDLSGEWSTSLEPAATCSPAVREPARPEDRWLLLYTSGTTGRPKGCQHSQIGYSLNAQAGAAAIGLSSDDRVLLAQPLFHVSGIHVLLSLFAAGACAVIPPRGVALEEMLHIVSAEAISVQSTPALGLQDYIDLQRRQQLPLKLRLMMGGGGLLSAETIKDIEAVFAVETLLGYGQSEGGGFLSFLSGREQLERPGSCGRPLPHLEARIVDADGNTVPPGEQGELVLRGPTLTRGYHKLAEESAELFTAGWLRTGDLFVHDAEGYLYFAGRRKELIKSAGENVYPAEVERILDSHPQIAASCVVGVQDARYGEAVKAFVVLEDGAHLTRGEIVDWCRGRIAGYKRPRYVQFVDSIARDFNGKARRTEMARLATADDDRVDHP